MMSRYERKLEKMERGNWFRKSLVVMGIYLTPVEGSLLLPWRFTPVIVFAWIFFMFELAIGLMLMVVVEVIVLFCPPLLLHLARNYYEDRSGVIA